jgi:4-amino-4-deoxy-L-arabinose transferase-like glycosyltransferase
MADINETLQTAATPTASNLTLPRGKSLRWIALSAIVALAAALRLANLNSIGYANHYYTAAVVSMLKSWHNFFFVAAEPGGAVSIDKPPLGLWIQAIFARLLGVNGFSVVLPEILAGILSVILIYHLVRRRFGTAAGLLAALVLAITPVVVATDRNNTADSTLILVLLLAAWAFIKATESTKLRYLLLGAALVGVGFNIKMLAAYLPLPAFMALYFLGAKEGLWRKLGKLSLAALLLATISLSWAAIVDLTPADQRPYVGSSGNNTVMSLIIGYNGVERLLGMGRGQTGLAGLFTGGSAQPGFAPGRGQPAFGGGVPTGGGPAGGFGGGPMGGTGVPGVTRLLIPPLSKETSWLLPLGLFGMLLLAFRSRLRWPISLRHQALVLWGGWLVTGAVFFSVAGFFHEYYLTILAPPLAALVGIGVMELWNLHARRPWLTMFLLLAAAGSTLVLQTNTAMSFVASIWWLPIVLVLVASGAAMLFTSAGMQIRWAALAGFTCIVVAVLITPGIWSGLTALNPTGNQSLPSAYSGGSSGPANGGNLDMNQALLSYLEQNTQNGSYLMAVPSSMQGADYVIATGRPVLYLGGFMGQDHVLNIGQLAQLVTSGKLRFIYLDAQGGFRGGFGSGFGGSNTQADISTWVQSNCKAVEGFDTATQNFGAPDGTRGGSNVTTFPGRGGMQVSLYDCGR